MSAATAAGERCPPDESLGASRRIATAFASITNAGLFDVDPTPTESARLSVDGVTCGITQLTGAPTPFTFQTTDPGSNLPIGTPNTPVDIPGGATQSFVISLLPIEDISPTEIQFGFNCTNSDRAPIIVGVNTLGLTASSIPAPDIIALAATLDGGIVDLSGPFGAGAFAVATTNFGESGTITVSADTGSASLPITIALCEDNSGDRRLSRVACRHGHSNDPSSRDADVRHLRDGDWPGAIRSRVASHLRAVLGARRDARSDQRRRAHPVVFELPRATATPPSGLVGRCLRTATLVAPRVTSSSVGAARVARVLALPKFTPGFAIVANAVAVCPTCTERLAGSTELCSVGGEAHPVSTCRAKSNTRPPVPACRHVPAGSSSSAGTMRTSSPCLLGLQEAPPSTLLNTPLELVPA